MRCVGGNCENGKYSSTVSSLPIIRDDNISVYEKQKRTCDEKNGKKEVKRA